MEKTKLEEKHGRLLKLLGGAIMLLLGLTLLIAPKMMESFQGSLVVFGIALLVTLITHGSYSLYKKKYVQKESEEGDEE